MLFLLTLVKKNKSRVSIERAGSEVDYILFYNLISRTNRTQHESVINNNFVAVVH